MKVVEDLIKEKDKEIERLKKREQECIDHYLVQCKYASEMEDKYITANNIINELEKCIKDKYYEAIDYQTKIRQSDLMQGNYPVRYYLEEQNEQLCNYFLNRLKDLQELKGVNK